MRSRRLRLLLAMVVGAGFAQAAPKAAPAQAAQVLEISNSCLAVGQRIPTLTVWGSGFDQYVNTRGTTLTIEWSWGGAPTLPTPAKVSPPTQRVTTGSFTLSFDVSGIQEGNGVFSAITTNANGARTLVDSVDMDVQESCPTGVATCSVDQGTAVLVVEVRGYRPTWEHKFFYQYRKPDQAGPVTGSAGANGAVVGRFRGLPPSTSPTVTARVVEPAAGDRSAVVYFLTFAVPVCRPPSPTTTTTALPNLPTTTLPVSIPSTTVMTVPPGRNTTTTSTTVVVPPATPGATLTLTPAVGPPGFVALARGAGFPPGPVTLTWAPGLGFTPATAGPDGTFAVRVLVFPKDRLGPRLAVATAGAVSANAAFLVVPPTVQPSGSDVTQITRIRRFTQR